MDITMVDERISKVVAVSIPIRNLTLGKSSIIKATYFYGLSMPTAFIAIPPSLHVEHSHPIILALRQYSYILFWRATDTGLDGAGVDIFEMHFWNDSLPRNQCNWIVVPSGRTSWVRHRSIDCHPLMFANRDWIGMVLVQTMHGVLWMH